MPAKMRTHAHAPSPPKLELRAASLAALLFWGALLGCAAASSSAGGENVQKAGGDTLQRFSEDPFEEWPPGDPADPAAAADSCGEDGGRITTENDSNCAEICGQSPLKDYDIGKEPAVCAAACVQARAQWAPEQRVTVLHTNMHFAPPHIEQAESKLVMEHRGRSGVVQRESRNGRTMLRLYGDTDGLHLPDVAVVAEGSEAGLSAENNRALSHKSRAETAGRRMEARAKEEAQDARWEVEGHGAVELAGQPERRKGEFYVGDQVTVLPPKGNGRAIIEGGRHGTVEWINKVEGSCTVAEEEVEQQSLGAADDDAAEQTGAESSSTAAVPAATASCRPGFQHVKVRMADDFVVVLQSEQLAQYGSEEGVTASEARIGLCPIVTSQYSSTTLYQVSYHIVAIF
jgi:hypothetical protein